MTVDGDIGHDRGFEDGSGLLVPHGIGTGTLLIGDQCVGDGVDHVRCRGDVVHVDQVERVPAVRMYLARAKHVDLVFQCLASVTRGDIVIFKLDIQNDSGAVPGEEVGHHNTHAFTRARGGDDEDVLDAVILEQQFVTLERHLYLGQDDAAPFLVKQVHGLYFRGVGPACVTVQGNGFFFSQQQAQQRDKGQSDADNQRQSHVFVHRVVTGEENDDVVGPYRAVESEPLAGQVACQPHGDNQVEQRVDGKMGSRNVCESYHFGLLIRGGLVLFCR